MTSADQAPASPEDRYQHGDMLMGKYELMSRLRVGGMGSLWKAYNRALDVDVAVKLIRADVASEEATRRLIQEARAAARVRHANIVRIFDFGQTDPGDPFIVMEWLEGEDLSERIRRLGRVPPATAVQILLPVISALGAAHAAGVVHRDLKPENVFLVPGEDPDLLTPKLLDFGIAKLEQTFDQRMTQEGVTMGSPAYMAPEQAKGRRDVGPPADVWAMCVLLYEMVTGTTPFDGDNYNALMAAICDDAPTPIVELMAGDAALWAILERGLRKDPAERWATMRVLGQELARWASDQGIETDVTGAAIGTVWLRTSLVDIERSSLTDVGRISGVHASDVGKRSGTHATQHPPAPGPAPASESGPVESARPFPVGAALAAAVAMLFLLAGGWALWGRDDVAQGEGAGPVVARPQAHGPESPVELPAKAAASARDEPATAVAPEVAPPPSAAGVKIPPLAGPKGAGAPTGKASPTASAPPAPVPPPASPAPSAPAGALPLPPEATF